MNQPKIKRRKIDELKFDNSNINNGSEFGSELLNKSIAEAGLGRSVVTDMNDILISGNKTAEAATNLGICDVIEIESTGKELIVVKRIDLDINKGKGVKMKILDNTVSKHNYRENPQMVAAVVEAAEISNLNEYGLSSIDTEEDEQVSFRKAKNIIKIIIPTDQEMEYALRDINYLMKQKYPGAIVKKSGDK
jgi:hypothetical protein